VVCCLILQEACLLWFSQKAAVPTVWYRKFAAIFRHNCSLMYELSLFYTCLFIHILVKSSEAVGHCFRDFFASIFRGWCDEWLSCLLQKPRGCSRWNLTFSHHMWTMLLNMHNPECWLLILLSVVVFWLSFIVIFYYLAESEVHIMCFCCMIFKDNTVLAGMTGCMNCWVQDVIEIRPHHDISNSNVGSLVSLPLYLPTSISIKQQ
jgi:hypothetical protein